MRWVTYSTGSSQPRTGIIDGGKVRGLPSGTRLLDLLGDDGQRLGEAGAQALRAPDEVLPVEDVRLLAPIPRPPSIRDGLCFLDHLRGCRRAAGQNEELDPVWFQTPAFYFANPAAVLGPYDDVPVSPGSHWFDLELEVALRPCPSTRREEVSHLWSPTPRACTRSPTTCGHGSHPTAVGAGATPVSSPAPTPASSSTPCSI